MLPWSCYLGGTGAKSDKNAPATRFSNLYGRGLASRLASRLACRLASRQRGVQILDRDCGQVNKGDEVLDFVTSDWSKMSRPSGRVLSFMTA